MSMLKKLLRYPNAAVWDKSPDAELAFRMNSLRGLKWRIADERLTVTIDTDVLEFDLSSHTVGGLIAQLRSFGILVQRESPAFLGRSARVLAEGSGDASTPTGDIIAGFKSVLWVHYAAYALELRTAKGQVREALRQMVLTQAEDEWLDVWGQLFGVPRNDGELDPEYQQRIPEEVTRLRVSKIAIEEAVYRQTGNRIYLREAWRLMFRLDTSRLSGNHRMVNNEAWRYGYLQPYAKDLFDWGDALAIIHRNKAAGVVVFEPVAEIDRLVDARVDGTVSFGAEDLYGIRVSPQFEFRLDHMRLGVTRPHRNWTAGHISEMVIMNTIRTGTWRSVGGSWPQASWKSWAQTSSLQGTVGARRISTSSWLAGRSWSQGGTWSNVDG